MLNLKVKRREGHLCKVKKHTITYNKLPKEKLADLHRPKRFVTPPFLDMSFVRRGTFEQIIGFRTRWHLKNRKASDEERHERRLDELMHYWKYGLDFDPSPDAIEEGMI